MKVKVRVQLSDKERDAAFEIVKECNKVDQTYRVPYLDNNYNDDPHMPSFVLAYEDDVVVGFLSIYADEPNEAEVSLYVLPTYRCQGIARSLLDELAKIAKRYHLTEISYVSENNFMKQHPAFIDKYIYKPEENELWMEQRGRQFSLNEKSDLKVLLADLSLVGEIAEFQAQAFDNSFVLAEKYARESINDENCLLYVLKKDEQVRASCSVDISLGTNYLFGLAVQEGYQGQGLGSYLVQSILNDLYKRNGRLCQIVVEAQNVGALKLYNRLGFEQKSEIIYLKIKKKIESTIKD